MISKLPNQNGVFSTKAALKLGECIEEKIKDALVSLGNDVRNILLHEKVKPISCLKFEELIQSEVVSSINTLLKRELATDKLRACRLLLALIPNDKAEVKKREQLYAFYSKVDGSYNEQKKKISNWAPEIWEESDKIIVKYIAKEISDCESVKIFAERIKCTESETIKWVDSLVDYLVKNEFSVIESRLLKILPNQNGRFCLKSDLLLDNGEIDETLKDICSELGYDFREYLLDTRICLSLSEAATVDEKRVAAKIIEKAQDLLHKAIRSEEDKKTCRKLIIWFNKDIQKAKKLFGDFYTNKHKLYEDDEIANSFQKLEETNELLEKYGVRDLNELEKVLLARQDTISQSSTATQDGVSDKTAEEKREITKEDLLQYGITSKDELEKAFEVKEFADRFTHKSTPSFEMFEFVQKLLERARENIKSYLSSLPNYDYVTIENHQIFIIKVDKSKEEVLFDGQAYIRYKDGKVILQSNMQNTKNINVFISYKHEDAGYADVIESFLKKKDIGVKRDIRDIENWASIKSFMKSIKDQDYAVLIISDAYLRSINCMYEVYEMMRDDKYKGRIFPYVLEESIYSIEGRAKYIKYWQEKTNALKESAKEIDITNSAGIANSINQVQKIQNSMDEFLETIADMNNPNQQVYLAALEKALCVHIKQAEEGSDKTTKRPIELVVESLYKQSYAEDIDLLTDITEVLKQLLKIEKDDGIKSYLKEELKKADDLITYYLRIGMDP